MMLRRGLALEESLHRKILISEGVNESQVVKSYA